MKRPRFPLKAMVGVWPGAKKGQSSGCGPQVGISEDAISWLYSKFVVHRIVEPLLAAQVSFRRFH
jgi:hypothetical protein